MAKKSRSIDARLGKAWLAVDNSQQHPEIREAVGEYGYDLDRLNAGKALWDTAQQLIIDTPARKGDLTGASETLKARRKEARTLYMKQLMVARVAFKNDEEIALSLKLNGERERKLDPWIGQAKTFYKNALSSPSVLDGMAEYNITPEKLEEGRALVVAVRDARVAWEKANGSARKARIDRDRALKALEDWVSDFRVIARVALVEKPMLMKALGFSPRG